MQAGDIVFLGSAVVGPSGSSVIHEQPPQIGIIEALDAGSPPTNVVVVWQDSRRTQYNAVGSGATSLLFVVGNIPTGTVPIVGFIVQPKSGSGIPNPGTRLQGPVIHQYGLEDPTGALVGQAIVVATPIGFLVIDPADATVLAAA